jgi:hypothetical protein
VGGVVDEQGNRPLPDGRSRNGLRNATGSIPVKAWCVAHGVIATGGHQTLLSWT